MTWIYSKLTGWLAAIGVALAILAAAYSRGTKDAAARQASARLQSINKARKVEDEIDRLDSAGVNARLNGWVRDGKR